MNGAVVQLVRTPACHAGGRGFKSLPRRHFKKLRLSRLHSSERNRYAAIAQQVERILGKDEVGSSNLPSSSKSLESSDSRLFSFCFRRFPAGKVENLIFSENSQTSSLNCHFGGRDEVCFMSRKRCFVNKKSGKKFEEIFDAFVVAKTAKGVSDVTIRTSIISRCTSISPCPLRI